MNRAEKKEKMLDLLAASGCVLCGEKDVRCLQWDHIKFPKSANVSEMVKRNQDWYEILEEMNKCRILCASCHCKEEEKKANTRRYKYWLRTCGTNKNS